MIIFEEGYEYFSTKFSGTIGEIVNDIIWKIGREIFLGLSGNLRFINRNLATPGGSYGVLP